LNVVSFNHRPSLQDALDVIDRLRADVQDGKIVAFFVAALDDSDASIAYCSSTKPVSRLRMSGAMVNALHAFNQGDQI
jgi:hypothetical protein